MTHAEVLVGLWSQAGILEVPPNEETGVPEPVTLVVTTDMFRVAIRVADMNGFPYVSSITYGGEREGETSVDVPAEVREGIEPSVPERRPPDPEGGWS